MRRRGCRRDPPGCGRFNRVAAWRAVGIGDCRRPWVWRELDQEWDRARKVTDSRREHDAGPGFSGAADGRRAGREASGPDYASRCWVLVE